MTTHGKHNIGRKIVHVRTEQVYTITDWKAGSKDLPAGTYMLAMPDCADCPLAAMHIDSGSSVWDTTPPGIPGTKLIGHVRTQGHYREVFECEGVTAVGAKTIHRTEHSGRALNLSTAFPSITSWGDNPFPIFLEGGALKSMRANKDFRPMGMAPAELKSEETIELIGWISPKGSRREVFACRNMPGICAQDKANRNNAFFVGQSQTNATFSFGTDRKIYAYGQAIESIELLATFERAGPSAAKPEPKSESLIELIGHVTPVKSRREVYACHMSHDRAGYAARGADAFLVNHDDVCPGPFNDSGRKIYVVGGAIESIQKLPNFETVGDSKAQAEDITIGELCGGCNLDVSDCSGKYLSCASGKWAEGRIADHRVSQEAWDKLKEADRRLQAPYPDDVAEAGW